MNGPERRENSLLRNLALQGKSMSHGLAGKPAGPFLLPEMRSKSAEKINIQNYQK